MPADLDLLEDDFRAKAEKVIACCKERGHILMPFFTLRDPWRQARLWRQSRTLAEINRAIAMLRGEDAGHIADMLSAVGPQYGLWATNALPGASWHQYGMACDCFVSDDGKAIWDVLHAGYIIYAEEAKREGLTVISREYVHMQMFSQEVLETTDWRTIDEMMLNKYGMEESRKT